MYNARIYDGGSCYYWRGGKDELAQLQAQLAAKQTCHVSPDGATRWHYGIEIAQSGIVLSGHDMTTTIYRWNWDRLRADSSTIVATFS